MIQWVSGGGRQLQLCPSQHTMLLIDRVDVNMLVGSGRVSEDDASPTAAAHCGGNSRTRQSNGIYTDYIMMIILMTVLLLSLTLC